MSHGKSLWKKWHRIKKDILNRDNNTVKKAIAKMPNGALPSGTDFSLFLDRVTYELYLAKEDEKKFTESQEDEVDDDAGIDDAGNDDAVDDDVSESHVEEGNEKDDDSIENDEHDEPKAPKSFFPSNLLVILVMGVLARECEPIIGYVCAEEGETSLAPVPSRNDCRLAGFDESVSTISKSSPVTRPDAVARLKRLADYNEVYKEASQRKDDLGRKRLQLDVDLSQIQMKAIQDETISRNKEVEAREKEVASRSIEIQTGALERMYKDLRDELKEAKSANENEEVEMIKEELEKVRKMRVDLITGCTNN